MIWDWTSVTFLWFRNIFRMPLKIFHRGNGCASTFVLNLLPKTCCQRRILWHFMRTNFTNLSGSRLFHLWNDMQFVVSLLASFIHSDCPVFLLTLLTYNNAGLVANLIRKIANRRPVGTPGSSVTSWSICIHYCHLYYQPKWFFNFWSVKRTKTRVDAYAWKTLLGQKQTFCADSTYFMRFLNVCQKQRLKVNGRCVVYYIIICTHIVTRGFFENFCRQKLGSFLFQKIDVRNCTQMYWILFLVYVKLVKHFFKKIRIFTSIRPAVPKMQSKHSSQF